MAFLTGFKLVPYIGECLRVIAFVAGAGICDYHCRF